MKKTDLKEKLRKMGYVCAKKIDNTMYFHTMSNHYNNLFIVIDIEENKVIDHYIKNTIIRRSREIKQLDIDFAVLENDVEHLK